MTNEELLQQAKDEVAQAEGAKTWHGLIDKMTRLLRPIDFYKKQNELHDRAAPLAIQKAREEAKVKYFNAGANYGYEAGQHDASSGHDRRKISGPIARISEHIDKIVEQ